MAGLCSFGSTTLYVKHDGYRGRHGSAGVVEIPLLPDLTADTPASVVQQAGRSRYRIQLECWAYSWDDYSALLSAHLAQTAATFSGPDGEAVVSTIEEITAPQVVLVDDEGATTLLEFGMTLLEA